MKKALFCLALAAAIPVPHAIASNVDFNVGINIGTRPQPVVVAPAPPPPRPVVVVPAPPSPQPVYVEPRVYVEETPLFIEPPELGFHVSVGTPHDIFFVGNRYYLCRDNVWYAAAYYGAPWTAVHYRSLPWKLRRHSYDRIRYYRDAGYRDYNRGNRSYWKRHHFRPSGEWREPACGENGGRKKARHEERDRSRHARYYGHGD